MLKSALFTSIALSIMIALVASRSASDEKYLIAGTVLLALGAMCKLRGCRRKD